MIKSGTLSIFILFMVSCTIKGQETVIGLQFNRSLFGNIPVVRANGHDTIDIPVIDDFSYDGNYPDNNIWEDDYVFINDSYSERQITRGVATFDILDNNGRMYETAGGFSFEADMLTSLPIDLNYLPSDDIVLSFFIEPGGIGDMPEDNDKLKLLFFDPVEETWEEVWENETTAIEGFTPVAIRIEEERFLRKGFRFRFLNTASLSNTTSDPSMVGNCDQWNIDYVKLDRDRGISDTIMTDVAFRFPNRSLLKTYEAMPWKQFKEISLQEMGTTFTVSYRNNDTITRNVTREFEITDIYTNTVVRNFSGGASNIYPLSDADYEVGHFYTFGSTGIDSALFRIRSWLKTDEFDRKNNDTIEYFQYFTNYFAYDDGSSESGYGINGLGSSNAMVAVKFRSYIADTIYAINICFNDSYMDMNHTGFNLMIWDNNQGLPGNVLLELEDRSVKQGDDVNGFYTYEVPYPIPVDGIFYVGWKQKSELFLNVGLDLNTGQNDRQFYWINGEWSASQVDASLMIRPLTGFPIITALEDITSGDENNKIVFWPNPALNLINVSTEGFIEGEDMIIVTDLLGRQLIKEPLSDLLDIGRLQKGMYIISITRNNRLLGSNRLIKNR